MVLSTPIITVLLTTKNPSRVLKGLICGVITTLKRATKYPEPPSKGPYGELRSAQ